MSTYVRVVTGVSTVIMYVKLLCRIYLKFQPKIINWINTSVPAGSRAAVLEWLDNAVIICAILVTSPDD